MVFGIYPQKILTSQKKHLEFKKVAENYKNLLKEKK
jgi:hypothetical protein